MTIRLVLAEDSVLVREGVLRMLASTDEIRVDASCSDFDEAMHAVSEHQPDVVLTDIRMPPTRTDEGVRLAEHCRIDYPGMGVVLLSQYSEPRYVKVLLAQGTDGRGYLLKERIADLDDLLLAIRSVAHGGSAIDPKVIEALVQTRSLVGDGSLSRLSPRERQVLASMAQGRTNAAIAASLVLSQHAVEKHINSIFAKLNLSGDQQNHPRVSATLMYLAEGGVE